MKLNRFIPLILLVIVAASTSSASAALTAHARGRIFVLMVWDGLRYDLVNQHDTPNLYALEHEGVSFPDHHAIFPTVTMANAAAIATGYTPGGSGIFGDGFYVPSAIAALGPKAPAKAMVKGINLENTPVMISLNQPAILDGTLVEAMGIGQRVRLAHGYVAVSGKSGPTFMFDSNDFTAAGGRNSNCNLIVDDLALGPAQLKTFGPPPPKTAPGLFYGARDAWYTDALIDQLPSAIAASNRGHPALLVLWERNPDCTQHRDGLGTEEALEALSRDDQNLGRLRIAINTRHIADRTDLMVVSDHGFVTLRDALWVSDLLVAAGLKKSRESTDVVAVGDQGSELIYLSKTAFPSLAARKERLQKIVNFVSAQPWSGPIFSRDEEPRFAAHGVEGWIAGTFDDRVVGLNGSRRAPDLIISMRENSDESNSSLTGPDQPAFLIGPKGRMPAKNHSDALVRPIIGTIDADASDKFTTGMGAHGAIGRREIHNFCAAVGPDFRRHFVDPYPTGNTDVAPTIAHVLGLRPPHTVNSSGWAGRVMSEALVRGSHHHTLAKPMTIVERRDLPPFSIETRLLFTSFDGHRYLDDARIERHPLPDLQPIKSSAPSP